MEKTTWSNVKIDEFPSLQEDIKTDILVIGGGICGILIAYRLKKEGKNVLVVEKNRIASQRTLKTTATITALQDIMYKDLSKEARKLYLDSCKYAINEYQKLSKTIDFDFEMVSSYKYFRKIDDFHDEYIALKEIGFEPNIHDYQEYHVMEFENQAQMNPLLLIKNLVKELNIYENTEIIKIEENKAYTKKNFIEFNNVVVTTGYPFMRFKGCFFSKMYQNKSCVIEIKNNQNNSFNAVGSEKGDIYVRTYKDSILIGGSDTRTGKKNEGFFPLIEAAKKYYDCEEIINKWVNQDCVTLDGIPYIGSLQKGFYVATGFNLWGMTSSMISSSIIKDLITGNTNKYAKLYRLNGRLPIGKFFINIIEILLNFLNPKIKRCSHLGCALIYNEIEDSYECMCHGSKYDKNGIILYNPANKNKSHQN